jgi:hypothetical protein
MGVNGSPEYELTWKSWDMKSGPPICALRASGRRTSGSACSGWPTPRTITGGAESAERKQELGRTASGGGDLQAAVFGIIPSSSPAPTANGEGCLVDGWKTPAAQDPGITLERLVDKDGNPWTPGQRAYDKDTGRLAQTGLTQMVGCLAGWQTPKATDWKVDVNDKGEYATRCQKSGFEIALPQAVKIHLTPKKNMKLNPRFSLWLMGYPIKWASCGERVTQ